MVVSLASEPEYFLTVKLITLSEMMDSSSYVKEIGQI